MKFSFIVIDDSELDCYIAEKLINHTGKSAGFKSFIDAASALEHISKQQPDGDKAVILLDIMMPVMNGFDFLESFITMPAQVQQQFLIIAITSSMNKTDIARIKNYEAVKGVIDKPVTINAVSAIISQEGLEWD
ncbi:response regulator [Pedobacter sp. BS3]|uniref:response regulator n=1 Tax=Pedobacter sp. BS3 TaxID=2567937 RepID=UPI0011EE5CD6|nr:response regulator [Pedobacter sp. BS3]TZF82584.1 response regulator [Pedobacter sp. BS3]